MNKQPNQRVDFRNIDLILDGIMIAGYALMVIALLISFI